MSNNLLSLESVKILFITLIPMVIFIIFSVFVICYYFIPLQQNQYQNPQSREASYTHRMPRKTDSDQFLACLQNRQAHQEAIDI